MEDQNQESWDDDLKFESREEFLNRIKMFYAKQGYVLSIKGSGKDKYVRLACDRGGCYRDKHAIPLEKRQRKTASRLINCPFEVQGKKIDGFWSLRIKNTMHNHEPSKDLSGHPTSRRLSKEDLGEIDEMTKSGVSTRQIISSLRHKEPNIHVVAKTVYNAKTKILKEKLGGRSSIQVLLEELGQSGFIHNMVQDEKGSLTHLFFCHPISFSLSRNYSTVFVMDCTYKTNKYKMPLLDIVGVSSFNTSFYASFAFLKNEGEDGYIWALQNFKKVLGRECHPAAIVCDRELALMKAIQVVFPNTPYILCLWHINKNILANCKRHFEVQEAWNLFLSTWYEVIYSKSESSFEESWQLFEFLYEDKGDVISYIKKTWIPLKEHFVSAWTERYLHLGNRVSSRAEGAHSKLKRYLQVSTSDLRIVKDKICLAITNEFEEITTQLSSEGLRTLHGSNIHFFKELNTRVSFFAMKELMKQFEMMKSRKMHAICTGHFTSTMGLPCSHKMLDYQDKVLPLTSVHSHWRIDTKSLSNNTCEVDEDIEFKNLVNEFKDCYAQWPITHKEDARERISQLIGSSSFSLLTEPNVQIPKGRPPTKKRKESTSTHRDLSQFEVVEATRRCGVCKGVGHNSRTCPKKNVMDFVESDGFFDLNMMPSFT